METYVAYTKQKLKVITIINQKKKYWTLLFETILAQYPSDNQNYLIWGD